MNILGRPLTVASVLMVVLSVLLGAAAQPETGSFFSYGYEVVASDGVVVAGSLTVSVVENLGSDNLRLRYEATFNDGTALLEKNLPSRFFEPPTIDFASLEGEYRITKEGGNISYSLSVSKTGENQRTVGGISYQTNVYRISATTRQRDSTTNIEGKAETIAESNVIYSLFLRLSSGGKTVEYTLFLKDSNVDLTQFTAEVANSSLSTTLAAMLASTTGDSQLFNQYNVLSSFAPVREADADVVKPKTASANNDQTERVAVFGIVGAATLAAVGLAAVKLGRRTFESGHRKAHYV